MGPRNIGRYQIKSELSRGGMSIVYLAIDPRFGRDVAIKVLPRSFQDQATARARFEREARIIAALEHPAIVPVYDFGDEDDQLYLVMRYMPGGSLADLLTYGRLTLADTTRIAQRVASALDEAHERGVIHRDLKPGNILFDTHGEAFLTDFGIVKLFESDVTTQNMTGSVVLGTPAYMSPEQALGKPLDQRSDVYSLGAVLYEMVTGGPPYKGPTSISVAMKHVVEPVPNPRELRPELPVEYEAIIEKAMAKEPDQRYTSAAELATALATATRLAPQSEQGTALPPPSQWPRPKTTSSIAPPGDDNLAASSSEPTTEAARPAQMTAPAPQRPRGITSRRAGLFASIGLIALLGVGALIGLLLVTAQPRPAPTITDTVEPIATIFIPTPTLLQPTSTTSEPAPTRNMPIVLPTAAALLTETESPALTPTSGIATLRVTVRDSNLRSGPGRIYPPIATLPLGTEMTAIATSGTGQNKWYQVALETFGVGWISDAVVAAVNPDVVQALPTAASIPATPVPAPTRKPEPTPTVLPIEPTATPMPTPIATPTVTPTVTPTTAPSPTVTPTPIPLSTFTPTPTSSPTNTAPLTPTATLTPTLVSNTTGTPTP
jgi:serine/threonine-protein kinase